MRSKYIFPVAMSCIFFTVGGAFADDVKKTAGATEPQKSITAPVSNEYAFLVSTKTKLRKTPDMKGLVYRFLFPGETVKVLEQAGEWLKVETKWKFESGKPMYGYVAAQSIKGREIEPLINVQPAKLENSVKANTAQSAIAPRVVAFGSQDKLKATEAVKTELEGRLQQLKAENLKLTDESQKQAGLVKTIQAALASKDMMIKNLQSERERMVAEITEMRKQLKESDAQMSVFRTGGNSRLFAMADHGEEIFFKGIGKAQMANADGKTIIKFPSFVANKADAVLAGARAARYNHNGFAYYILDTSALVF